MDYEEKIKKLVEKIFSLLVEEDKAELNAFVEDLSGEGKIGSSALIAARKFIIDDQSKTDEEKEPLIDELTYQYHKCCVINKLNLKPCWHLSNNEERVMLIKQGICDQMGAYINSTKRAFLTAKSTIEEWSVTRSISNQDITDPVYKAFERVCVNAMFNKVRYYKLLLLGKKFYSDIDSANTIEEINTIINQFIDLLAKNYDKYYSVKISSTNKKQYAKFKDRLEKFTDKHIAFIEKWKNTNKDEKTDK